VENAMSNERFIVSAGKYEADGELNTKYTEEFNTLAEGIYNHMLVSDYPWSELLYITPIANTRIILSYTIL
jgi:hypothetical protein